MEPMVLMLINIELFLIKDLGFERGQIPCDLTPLCSGCLFIGVGDDFFYDGCG